MLIRKIFTFIKLIYYFLLSFKGNKISKFLDPGKTVDIILQQHKSVIRFGDGEFNILDKKNVSYQIYSKSLRIELQKCIDFYIDNEMNVSYILCMPREFLNCSGMKILHSVQYFKSWSFSRYYFNKKYDKAITYGDAFLFSNENINYYDKIWKNGEVTEIVFIHNDKKYADRFSDKYKKKVYFISIPDQNSFEIIDDIILKVKNVINKHNKLHMMVLISAGPCGKIIVRRLSEYGIWAIDTGHCWDSPLHNWQ